MLFLLGSLQKNSKPLAKSNSGDIRPSLQKLPRFLLPRHCDGKEGFLWASFGECTPAFQLDKLTQKNLLSHSSPSNLVVTRAREGFKRTRCISVRKQHPGAPSFCLQRALGWSKHGEHLLEEHTLESLKYKSSCESPCSVPGGHRFQ